LKFVDYIQKYCVFIVFFVEIYCAVAIFADFGKSQA